MKNRHGPKGGRGSSVYRCNRRGDERVIRTDNEIADLNVETSDKDDDDEDEDDGERHLQSTVYYYSLAIVN